MRATASPLLSGASARHVTTPSWLEAVPPAWHPRPFIGDWHTPATATRTPEVGLGSCLVLWFRATRGCCASPFVTKLAGRKWPGLGVKELLEMLWCTSLQGCHRMVRPADRRITDMDSPLAAYGAERRSCPRWPSLETASCSRRGEASGAAVTHAWCHQKRISILNS